MKLICIYTFRDWVTWAISPIDNDCLSIDTRDTWNWITAVKEKTKKEDFELFVSTC